MLHATEHGRVAERFASLFDRFERSESSEIDAAKLEISEQIYLAMERQGVSKAELARRLGKSRAYVTKVLQGRTNFTLESLVRITRALKCKLDFRLMPERGAVERSGDLEDLWQARQRASFIIQSKMKRHQGNMRPIDLSPNIATKGQPNADKTISVAA